MGWADMDRIESNDTRLQTASSLGLGKEWGVGVGELGDGCTSSVGCSRPVGPSAQQLQLPPRPGPGGAAQRVPGDKCPLERGFTAGPTVKTLEIATTSNLREGSKINQRNTGKV